MRQFLPITLVFVYLWKMVAVSETQLYFNKVKSFLIEDLVIREEEFLFSNPSSKISSPYLVVNFNQFRIHNGQPDLPVIKVTGMANGQEHNYFSTIDAGWMFDENMIFLPLLNFEKFKIKIFWRRGGFKTTFLGQIGVFSQNSIDINFQFTMPIFIPPGQVDPIQINFIVPPQEKIPQAIVSFQTCQGSLQKATLLENGRTEQTQVPGDEKNYFSLQDLKDSSQYTLELLGHPSELTVVRLSSLRFSDSLKPSLEALLKHSLELETNSETTYLHKTSRKNNFLTWTNFEYSNPVTEKFVSKTMVSVDTDESSLLFKGVCGFSKSLIFKGYPRLNSQASDDLFLFGDRERIVKEGSLPQKSPQDSKNSSQVQGSQSSSDSAPGPLGVDAKTINQKSLEILGKPETYLEAGFFIPKSLKTAKVEVRELFKTAKHKIQAQSSSLDQKQIEEAQLEYLKPFEGPQKIAVKQIYYSLSNYESGSYLLLPLSPSISSISLSLSPPSLGPSLHLSLGVGAAILGLVIIVSRLRGGKKEEGKELKGEEGRDMEEGSIIRGFADSAREEEERSLEE